LSNWGMVHLNKGLAPAKRYKSRQTKCRFEDSGRQIQRVVKGKNGSWGLAFFIYMQWGWDLGYWGLKLHWQFC
jgi:hypothetical protein